MCTEKLQKNREHDEWCLTLSIDCPSWRFLFQAAGLLAAATTTNSDDPDGDDDDVQPRDFNIILSGWRVERAGAARSILQSRELLRPLYRLVSEYRFRFTRSC